MFRQINLSNDFIKKIIEQVAGRVPQNVLEDFLSLLEKEIKQHYFTNSSESNLLRIIQHQFDAVVFINDCLKYPHQIEILVTIANNSNYLSDILVRNPEYFTWIVNPSVMNQKIDEKYYSDLLDNSLSTFKSFSAKVNVIRNFKRKEILRIGIKDIFLKEDLKFITRYLSNLAIVISRKLFKLCYTEVLKKHGIEKIKNRFVVFSVGKLGANELNYSSDIDLIAFYDKNTLIGKRIFYAQIVQETILLFIETASQKTGSGFLYRVDFRLRPDGRNAPLCGSYLQYMNYYEMRGEAWERQMLIKANYLCGSKNLYNNFSDYISRFIYPTNFSVSPVEQIKRLKINIEQANKSDENIKLIPGGIRDIEFSIQALQLLNGGKDKSVRNSNTLNAIQSLSNKNIISLTEANSFTKAYYLYRKVEHYLQLMNDQQTHNIPANGELVEKLSHFLGFNDLNSFKEQIDSQRILIQNIYNSIVNITSDINKTNSYSKVRFIDLKRSLNNLEFLRIGKSLLDKKQFDIRTTLSFENIEPQLISFLINSVDADLVLENFVRVIRTANFPQIWYNEFNDNKFFNIFFQLCEQSQKAIDLFAEDKSLRDDFLTRKALVPLDNFNDVNLNLKSFFFRSSVQLISKSISAKTFPKLFTNYLDHNFKNIIKTFSSDKKWKDDFFVAALGSFGSSQLSFSSDIDLIFVIKNINEFPGVQKDFQHLLQLLRNNLPGLEIDCRLRPEGKNSLLVWDIYNYKKYFSTRARTWEYQAFTKCRLIYGNSNLFNDLLEHYIQNIEKLEQHKMKIDILEMRKKLLPINNDTFNIKKSSGGLVDIDFMITYLLLSNPYLILQLNGKSLLDSPDTLEKILDFKTVTSLINNYNFLKEIELAIQNIFNTKVSKIPSDESKLIKLSKALGFAEKELLSHKINTITAEIRKLYQEILTGKK